MKWKFAKPHPAEVGAGIGLMTVCIVVMIIDKSMVPFGLMFNSFGLLLAMGAFSENKNIKKCKTKTYEK
jgi:hypothetical protein